MSAVGDILSTVGVFSTVGDIMINVGDILSTMGVFSTVGGKSFVILILHGTEHPPRYSNLKGWYPHGTHDIPHGTQDNPPRYS